MTAPPLISSQRFLNRDIVIRKALTFKVFIVMTLDIQLRGKLYRVLLDGHHNLAAAQFASVEPTWKGPPPKFERFRKRMKPEDFAAFMINNLTDSDWYFHETGEVVLELLAREAA
jgi:hypothetical protein